MFEVLKIRMHEKKSLFEPNEKVLRSSFEIIFGVRTARVFELKKNSPYLEDFLLKECCTEDIDSVDIKFDLQLYM